MDYSETVTNMKSFWSSLNIRTMFNYTVATFGVYMCWITLHYLSVHMYVYWCVPATLTGVIMSAFLVPAPHCYSLRWAIYNGGNSIIGMWSLLGAWLIGKIKKD